MYCIMSSWIAICDECGCGVHPREKFDGIGNNFFVLALPGIGIHVGNGSGFDQRREHTVDVVKSQKRHYLLE